MNLSRIPVSPFVELTYILWTAEGGEAIVIDPGMMTADERTQVVQFLESHRLTLRRVLLTHIHIDHVASAQWLAQRYQAPIEGGEADEPMGAFLPLQAAHFGLKIDVQPLKLDGYLKHNDIIRLGDEEIRVLEVPGHSPGSLAFYAPESHLVIGGDVLFASSIGRCALPGSSFDVLIHSIRTQLFTLPDDTVVYPGHGPETTIGEERVNNPFLI